MKLVDNGKDGALKAGPISKWAAELKNIHKREQEQKKNNVEAEKAAEQQEHQEKKILEFRKKQQVETGYQTAKQREEQKIQEMQAYKERKKQRRMQKAQRMTPAIAGGFPSLFGGSNSRGGALTGAKLAQMRKLQGVKAAA